MNTTNKYTALPEKILCNDFLKEYSTKLMQTCNKILNKLLNLTFFFTPVRVFRYYIRVFKINNPIQPNPIVIYSSYLLPHIINSHRYAFNIPMIVEVYNLLSKSKTFSKQHIIPLYILYNPFIQY